MNWSFGIVTDGKNPRILGAQVNSIQALDICDYEILIVGGEEPGSLGDPIRHIEFDESSKPNWITRKKNLLALNAKYENLVICHDYVGFDKDWAAGYEMFGSEWNIALNRVVDIKGRRFYDWVYWDSPSRVRYSPVPYSRAEEVRFQFISGAFWAVKTEFMLKNPLNEDLVWGQAEDVEWSLRVREKGLKFNPYSLNHHLKKHRGYKTWKSIYNDGIQFSPRPDFKNWDPI